LCLAGDCRRNPIPLAGFWAAGKNITVFFMNKNRESIERERVSERKR